MPTALHCVETLKRASLKHVRVSVFHLFLPFQMSEKWFWLVLKPLSCWWLWFFPYQENKTIEKAEQRELYVMDIYCNVTTLEDQAQINSTTFHLVKMVSMCVSCALNIVLSIPLLLVIARPPSLLTHTRFLLLSHLLLCDNLQVL